jgi:hypothetical protein
MVFDGFRPPYFDAPVSLAAHIAALPADAMSKGMFFNALYTRCVGNVEVAFDSISDATVGIRWRRVV